MDVELRPVTDDEFLAYVRQVELGFGETPSDEELERHRPVVELDRTLAGFEDERIVSTAGANSMELTVPGARQAPMAGVTAVGVAPTHRRRGLLRQMMGRVHDDARQREEPLVGLLSTEAPIYGRFGYGVATLAAGVKLDARSIALADTVDELTAGGRTQLIDLDEARAVVPEVFDRFRRGQVGAVDRSAARHHRRLADRETDRHGRSSLQVAVREVGGSVEGVAIYRLKPGREGTGTVTVVDLVATTDHAWLALWGHLLSIDLMAVVECEPLPVDDPLRHALVDPRRYRTEAITDWLWLHLLDVPAALAARTYDADDRLVLEVVGPDGARVDLDAQNGRAEVRTTRAEPDLIVTTQALASLYLGGFSARQLAAAGRLRGDHAAVDRLDRLFRTPTAPWCNTMF